MDVRGAVVTAWRGSWRVMCGRAVEAQAWAPVREVLALLRGECGLEVVDDSVGRGLGYLERLRAERWVVFGGRFG
ncbi:hypothetical protein GCM10010385_66730 [Streptomyces geysiriensis]|nr:hypothetical protein GCM10010385_66730 [Streptomyces geysiriensis]